MLMIQLLAIIALEELVLLNLSRHFFDLLLLMQLKLNSINLVILAIAVIYRLDFSKQVILVMLLERIVFFKVLPEVLPFLVVN